MVLWHKLLIPALMVVAPGVAAQTASNAPAAAQQAPAAQPAQSQPAQPAQAQPAQPTQAPAAEQPRDAGAPPAEAAAGAQMSTATPDGAGNTTVTLHDGSTITFIGISTLNSTFFTTH